MIALSVLELPQSSRDVIHLSISFFYLLTIGRLSDIVGFKDID